MNSIRESGLSRGWRITVRLDAQRAEVHRNVCQKTGLDASHAVRKALDGWAAPPPTQRTVSPHSQAPVPPETAEHVAAIRPPNSSAAATSLPQVTAPATLPAPKPLITHSMSATLFSKSAELLSQYRAFGAQIWPERRRLFQRLLAAASVAQECRENPKDAELYGDLLQLAGKYNVQN